MTTETTILEQLIEVEHDALAKYCKSVNIRGEIAQVIEVDLKPKQTMWTSRGSLMSYSERILWSLKVPGGASKALGRMLSGEGAALTYVEAPVGGKVYITANQPGKLATWDLRKGSIICTSGAFVAALGDVDIEVTVARSAGAAIFGGAGLFLQKLSGDGVAIVHGAGDFVEKQLTRGEKMLVSTGNLAVFSADVNYNVRGVGGCFKSLFGGEGIFMTEMQGPGWVMLQSLKKAPTTQRR